MKAKITILICFLLVNFSACKTQNRETIVIMDTDFGQIKLKLYNETPLHRDNFIKLIKLGFYKDRIFHRVINTFMIQGGDAALPEGIMFTGQQDTFKYTIPAEFVRNILHKKGALAAARMGDDVNPNQESSPTQFYIVQGKTFKADQLSQIEQNINHSLLRKNFVNICKQEAKNNALTKPQIEKIAEQKALEIQTKNPFKYTPEEISMYETIGGTPHLDMNYTVFGEVIAGLEVIDQIASQQTNEMDRPLKDIKFSIRITE